MKDAWRSWGWGGLLIVLLTVLAYWPALRGGFIWDDDTYVTGNPLLTAPDGLRRIWFSPHHQSQYFPLVYTTLRLERMWWGLNPIGYHAVNVVLHVLNGLLVWAVLRRLAVPGAWWAAAIWAVHPVNVESVAWITELKNTQSTLFYLLALLAWMKFTGRESVGRWRFYALALLLYALALLSKTTACTLPAALLLVLWLRKEPIGWRRSVAVAPFLVLGLAMGWLSVWWEAHLGNYADQAVGVSLGGLERLLIATHAVWFYAGKLVWPTKLAFSYARWEINPRDPRQYLWLIGGLAVVWLWWRRRPVLERAPVAAVVFFVAALSPLLGLIPLYTFRYSFVADHYQYLACVGLIALAVGVGATVARRAGQRGRELGTLAGAAVLLMLGVATWRQTHVYYSLETLWRDTLAKNPTAWIAHNNLGIALEDLGKVPEAKEHYEQALQIKPDYAEAHNNLGNVLSRTGKPEEAIGHYKQALRLQPVYPEAHNNLGNALALIGKVQEAIRCYEQALRINPRYAEAHYNLGNALRGVGRAREAISRYEQALKIKPDYAEAHYNLGAAFMKLGRLPEAVEHLKQALRIKPNYAEAHTDLGNVMKTQGKVAEAIEHYEEALKIDPDIPEAHYDLGNSLLQMGRIDEAIGHYEQALRIEPDLAEAHYNLGLALVGLGKMPQAIAHWEQALRIKPDYAEAHNNLGVALERAGRAQEAIGHYEQALRIKPDYAEARNRLARLRAAQ